MRFKAIGGSGPDNHGPGAIKGVSARWDKIGEIHNIDDNVEIQICMKNDMLEPADYIHSEYWKEHDEKVSAEKAYKESLTMIGFNPETSRYQALMSFCVKNKIAPVFPKKTRAELVELAKQFIMERSNAESDGQA